MLNKFLSFLGFSASSNLVYICEAMGLLSIGSPLSWEETKKFASHVQHHGIKQFINIYHRLNDRKCDVLKWGDEVSRKCEWVLSFFCVKLLVNLSFDTT